MNGEYTDSEDRVFFDHVPRELCRCLLILILPWENRSLSLHCWIAHKSFVWSPGDVNREFLLVIQCFEYPPFWQSESGLYSDPCMDRSDLIANASIECLGVDKRESERRFSLQLRDVISALPVSKRKHGSRSTPL